MVVITAKCKPRVSLQPLDPCNPVFSFLDGMCVLRGYSLYNLRTLYLRPTEFGKAFQQDHFIQTDKQLKRPL